MENSFPHRTCKCPEDLCCHPRLGQSATEESPTQKIVLVHLDQMSWSPTEVTRSRTHLLPWISGLPRRRPSKKTTLWSIPSPTKPASVKTLHAVTLTQLQDEITGLQMDLRLKNQPTKLSQTERGEFPTL